MKHAIPPIPSGVVRALLLPLLMALPLPMALPVQAAAPAATDPPPVAADQFRIALDALTRQAAARIASANATPELRGSGPFPAMMEVDLALPHATIYRPANLAAMGRQRLGLVIWGNGGCKNDGAEARAHLAEIASHGFLVIAPGKPLTGPLAAAGAPAPLPMTTTVADLRALLDWALAENGRPGSPFLRRIDPRAIAVAGHSCGGIQSIILAADPRIKTAIIHNSGAVDLLPDNPPLVNHAERLAGLHGPVLLVSGGRSDVLWDTTNRTFGAIAKVPVAMVSSDVGHMGTFAQAHGGRAAAIAVDWLEWQLRGKRDAARSFLGPDCGLCHDPAWTIARRNWR